MSEGRTILHVDMDAFFVSVELLRRPELVGRPVVVGGDGARGVVAAASYEARAFGVYSALGSLRAKRLCPHAVFLPGDYGAYAAVSHRVMDLLRDVTPLVEPLSLDEAFLDVTGVLHGRVTGAELAADIRARIFEREGLSCGVGVAPSKFLAKVASKHAKPRIPRPGRRPTPGRGVVEVTAAETEAFLRPLSIAELWGVGPVTEKRLNDIGVHTIGDLAALSPGTLVSRVGKASGIHLHQLANGIDNRPVVPDSAPKSIGHEETFGHDHHSLDTLWPELVRLVDATSTRLHERSLVGRTISIKVRYADFRTVTRAVTLAQPTDRARVLGREARALLARLDLGTGVRLLGVSVSGLSSDTGLRQLTLDDVDTGEESWEDAARVIANIRDRFGADAIAPAVLVDRSGLQVRGRGDRQWGPGHEDDRGDETKRR